MTRVFVAIGSRDHSRFMERILVVGECWVWHGDSANGYGRFKVGGKRMYAHRVSYETYIGEIPDGLTIDHLCRNRRCVNPEHLEAVTRGENVLRGESEAAKAARRDRCQRGHEYTPENTRTTRGWRECRACGREKRRARMSSPEARAERSRMRREKYAMGHRNV